MYSFIMERHLPDLLEKRLHQGNMKKYLEEGWTTKETWKIELQNSRDIDVTVLSDGCAAFSPEVHRVSIDALRPVARVMSAEECMRALFS